MENEFEWDENKDVLNYQKHHLHFEDVIYVFADKCRLSGPILLWETMAERIAGKPLVK